MPCVEQFKKELLPGHRVNNAGEGWKTRDKFFRESPIKTPYRSSNHTTKEKLQEVITRKKRSVNKAKSFKHRELSDQRFFTTRLISLQSLQFESVVQ